MKSKVFLSSIMQGYSEFREAARSTIEAEGAIPLLVEDQPSLPNSSRNACLDLVSAADVVVVLVGPRGGWRAPSGKVVVQEEFEEAKRLGKLILVFVDEADKDADALALAEGVSDYVHGVYRTTYSSHTELAAALEPALRNVLEGLRKPATSTQEFQDRLGKGTGGQFGMSGGPTQLRLLVAPRHIDELVDPVELDGPAFEKRVQGIAHQVELFSYSESKHRDGSGLELRIVQGGDRHQRMSAALSISREGWVSMELDLESAAANDDAYSLSNMFEIAASDVSTALARCFAFVSSFFQEIDEYHSTVNLLYNVAILNPGSRQIVTRRSAGNSYSTGWLGEDIRVAVAYEQPRGISRALLSSPENEIERAVVELRHRLRHR